MNFEEIVQAVARSESVARALPSFGRRGGGFRKCFSIEELLEIGGLSQACPANPCVQEKLGEGGHHVYEQERLVQDLCVRSRWH